MRRGRDSNPGGRLCRPVPSPSATAPEVAESIRRCADVVFDETAEQDQAWYDAEVGDIVWTFGKAGSHKNDGHVVVKIASCATDTNYCDLEGYSILCEHRLVAMCECGDMWKLDHHSVILRPKVVRPNQSPDSPSQADSEP